MPPELPWHRTRTAKQGLGQLSFGTPKLFAGISEYLIAGVTFPAEAVREALPNSLEPTETLSGGLIVFQTEQNVGFPKFDCAQVWIDVKGHDTPEGVPGRYVVGGFYSQQIVALALSATNSFPLNVGWARLQSVDSEAFGEGGGSGGAHVEVGVRRARGVLTPATYYHYYIGVNQAGDIETLPMGVLNNFEEVRPEHVDISVPQVSTTGLKPTSLLWAARPRDAVFAPGDTIVGHASWTETKREAIAVDRLSSFLGCLGQGAILCDPRGFVLTLNAPARRVLGCGLAIHKDRLVAAGRTQNAIDGLLAAALAPSALGDALGPIAVPRDDGRPSLLMQAVPIGPSNPSTLDLSPGRARLALLLITDVEEPIHVPLKSLVLLGLTPAEARIASAVGTGLSPRVAAARLGVTENTVRSALTLIYAKLMISRQSELALLVARLSSNQPVSDAAVAG